jgi:hypothetical protein
VLAFATPPQTVPAGTATAAIRLSLLNSSGQPFVTPVPLSVTLSSSSPAGTFSTSPTGPWTPTLALTIAAGTGTSGDFYYLDTRAGSALLTASAFGTTSGTQTVTVTPGPVASVSVSPPSPIVRTRATVQLAALGRDAFGNTLPVSAAWSLAPAVYGKVAPRTGPTTTVTLLRATGEATVTAMVGTFSAKSTLRVRPDRLRIRSIQYARRAGAVVLTMKALDSAGRPISRAAIAVAVQLNRRPYFSGRAVTGAAGKATFRMRVPAGGCFRATVRRVSSPGFSWDSVTPRNRYCRSG